jgi:micrococcal nuclease
VPQKTLKLYIHIFLLALSISVYLYNTYKNPAQIETQHITQSQTEGDTFTIEKIIDGDTITVKNTSGEKFKVRILGINAPESVDPRRPVACFGKESANFLEGVVLLGSVVHLQKDDTQTDRDRYDRLIRYVEIDGKDVGLESIKQGFSYEYTYKLPYERQVLYKQAQSDAKRDKKGLWGGC